MYYVTLPTDYIENEKIIFKFYMRLRPTVWNHESFIFIVGKPSYKSGLPVVVKLLMSVNRISFVPWF